MPIKPENRGRYPANWRAVRASILRRAEVQLADHLAPVPCCEMAISAELLGAAEPVTCGAPNGMLVERAGFVWWECLTPADKRLVKPTKVVLTIAHLDQQPEHNDPSNLRALCQRCHLTYDATWRRMAAENGKPPTVAECIERWADLYGRGGV